MDLPKPALLVKAVPKRIQISKKDFALEADCIFTAGIKS